MTRVGSILGLLALAGCSAGNCDPNRVGFIGGAACAASGYDQRTAGLQRDVATAQGQAAALERVATAAGNDATAAKGELRARQEELARLNRRLGDLSARLGEVKAHAGVDQNAVARAQREFDAVAALQAAAARVNTPTDLGDLRAIDRRQSSLLKLLNDML